MDKYPPPNQNPPEYNETAPPAYPGPPVQGYPGAYPGAQAQAYPGGYPQPAPYPQAAPYPATPEQPAAYNPPTQTVATTVVTPATTVLVPGNNCSVCGIGYIQEEYTTLGIVLAIIFFPWGLLCCLLMKERRCSHCGRFYN